LFLGLSLASLIFLSYPYRFFCAEGYLQVIFLCTIAMDNVYTKIKEKYFTLQKAFVLCVVAIFIFSPTLLPQREAGKTHYKVMVVDSAFMQSFASVKKGYGFSSSIWFAPEYLSAAEIIRKNSECDDIIYSSIDLIGVALAAVSGRTTSNALFPEIGPAERFDPLAAAKIIIMAKDEDPGYIARVVQRYKLTAIGENKIFLIYRNPSGLTNKKPRISRGFCR